MASSPTSRRLISSALSLLAATYPALAAAEIQRFAVGNSARPWATSGELEAIDVQTQPGWIRPVWIEPDISILHQLFLDGMLYTGEAPKSADFRPEVDARIWTVNATGSKAGDGENANLILLADGREDDQAFDYFVRRATSNAGVSIVIDLGVPFPVNEIRFYPRLVDPHDDNFVRGYQLFANDGNPAVVDQFGKPVFFLLDEVATNFTPLVQNSDFPPQYIRYIKFRATAPDPFEMDQLEIRGEGSVKRAAYISAITDTEDLVGDIGNFGRIFWAAVAEPGSRATVRTRFARTLDETEDWEWSDPYGESGQELIAEGPARFFQFRIDLESEVISSQARIDSIALEFSSPTPARQVLASIAPDTVDVGRPVAFTYRIEPDIGPNDIGFDTVLLDTPSPSAITRVRLRGDLLAESEYETQTEKNLLSVRLLDPANRITDNEDVLELGFNTTMLIYGTVFSGRVQASWEEDLLSQRLEATEAGALTVLGSEASLGRVLGKVASEPPVFSPNGDGVNDQTLITFRVAQVLGGAPLVVRVFDLAGHRVATVLDREVESDTFQVPWNGRNDAGTRVPPGIYLLQVDLAGDARNYSAFGTVGIAY